MASESQNSRSSITVEKLLRLKRQEKPDSAFWEDFDRSLKSKTLQVLVKKEPLYKRMAHLIALRAAPIAGCAAAVIFGFGFWSNTTLLVDQSGPEGADVEIPTQELETPVADTVGVAMEVAEVSRPLEAVRPEPVAARPDVFERFRSAADFGADVIAVTSASTVNFRKDHDLNVFRMASSKSSVYNVDSVLTKSGRFGGTF